jgi:hypothetical protein
MKLLFSLTLLLLLGTTLSAQQAGNLSLDFQGNNVSLQGQSFSIGELLEQIVSSHGITIVNRSTVIDRNEQVGGTVTSPEMVRDVVDQVLSGTPFYFYSYVIDAGRGTITVLGQDRDGNDMRIEIVIDAETGQVLSVTVVRSEAVYRTSLKTNLLYTALTGTINAGAEFFLNEYLTLDVAAGWNPFTGSADNKKFNHAMVQLTPRYWFKQGFSGQFAGLSLMYARFNAGGLSNFPYSMLPNLENYRYFGDAYGATLQYGYRFALSRRVAVEASINAGYIRFDYLKYECQTCGEFIEDGKKNYFGPANAAVSIIYNIK